MEDSETWENMINIIRHITCRLDSEIPQLVTHTEKIEFIDKAIKKLNKINQKEKSQMIDNIIKRLHTFQQNLGDINNDR